MTVLSRYARKDIEKMQRQIQQYKENCNSYNTESTQNYRIAGETNNQILALKAKHEEEKERFELEIKKLQEKLKERDEPIEFDDKSFKPGTTTQGKGIKKEEFSNPILILMRRVSRIKAVNRKKKMILDQYIKNAQILEQAFDQMKEFSGIANIDEIVTTYIKAEDQNYSLYNYVNMLGQENDAYEENTKYLEGQIEMYKDLDDMNEQQKKQQIKELQ